MFQPTSGTIAGEGTSSYVLAAAATAVAVTGTTTGAEVAATAASTTHRA